MFVINIAAVISNSYVDYVTFSAIIQYFSRTPEGTRNALKGKYTRRFGNCLNPVPQQHCTTYQRHSVCTATSKTRTGVQHRAPGWMHRHVVSNKCDNKMQPNSRAQPTNQFKQSNKHTKRIRITPCIMNTLVCRANNNGIKFHNARRAIITYTLLQSILVTQRFLLQLKVYDITQHMFRLRPHGLTEPSPETVVLSAIT
jgi:hypothetical protein